MNVKKVMKGSQIGAAFLVCLLSLGAWGASAKSAPQKGHWMEGLGLSPNQVPKLLEVLGTRREELSPLFSRRRQIMAELSQELKSKAPESKIAATLAAFDQLKERMRKINEEFIAGENNVLTPIQRARLIVARSQRFQKMRAQKKLQKAS